MNYKFNKECLVDISRPGAQKIQQALQNKLIEIYSVTNQDLDTYLLSILDEGETAAIALAEKLDAPLLMDEKLGRAAAKKRHLKVIGSLGVFLLAKQKKRLKNIKPLIQELKNAGYYLSDSLVSQALALAKETALGGSSSGINLGR